MFYQQKKQCINYFEKKRNLLKRIALRLNNIKLTKMLKQNYKLNKNYPNGVSSEYSLVMNIAV